MRKRKENIVGHRYRVAIYLQEDVYKKFLEYAEERGLHLSTAMNLLLREFFKLKGKGESFSGERQEKKEGFKFRFDM